MRQGLIESNDNYMKRFNSNLQTLELAGGEHILKCFHLTKCVNKNNPTEVEIKVELKS